MNNAKIIIIRILNLYDSDIVIFPKHKSASLTPVAKKTAAGAADSLKIYQVTNIVSALEILKDNGFLFVDEDDPETVYIKNIINIW